MNNETKILSWRDAVEILGKLYADQIKMGEWRKLSDDEMTALNIAIFALEKDIYERENVTADGWTPIEKGMPPEDGWYLVTLRGDDGFTFIGTDLYQHDRDGGFILHKNIVAWMEQPNTYKGGKRS